MSDCKIISESKKTLIPLKSDKYGTKKRLQVKGVKPCLLMGKVSIINGIIDMSFLIKENVGKRYSLQLVGDHIQ